MKDAVREQLRSELEVGLQESVRVGGVRLRPAVALNDRLTVGEKEARERVVTVGVGLPVDVGVRVGWAVGVGPEPE